VIVQGRYDVRPMISAWELHRVWPEAEFIIVPDAGHSMSEPGIRSPDFGNRQVYLERRQSDEHTL